MVPLLFPVYVAEARGRRWFCERGMIVDSRIGPYGLVVDQCPEPGWWTPNTAYSPTERATRPFTLVTTGRPLPIVELLDEASTTPSAGGIWTERPPTSTVDEHELDPNAPEIVWTCSTRTTSATFSGNRVESLTAYGLGQLIAWRLNDSGLLVGSIWPENRDTAPELVAILAQWIDPELPD